MTIVDQRSLHRDALELTTSVLQPITADDLNRPTPCAGWDLGQLLGHLIGQNNGFADAVASACRPDPADVGADAFAPRPPDAEPLAEWLTSADLVATAFAEADLERPVLLAEISTEHRLPAGTVVSFHLLDTVVHGWDLAEALGQPYLPNEQLVTASLAIAKMVPDGPEFRGEGAAFGPSVEVGHGDDWDQVLALLGRRR